MAKLFVSEEPDLKRDRHRLKINVRCDKMGMIGNICPDRGDPTLKYAKDIGMRRSLSEQQYAININLEYHMMDLTKLDSLSNILKSGAYTSLVKSKMGAEKHRIDAKLHIYNEAVDYANQGSIKTETIAWIGEGHESFSTAMGEVTSKHIFEYREQVSRASGICEPTTYMTEHLPKALHNPFGIFVNFEGHKMGMEPIDEDVGFLGEDAPPKLAPETVAFVPEPTQDELYEDWGAFG